jgi:ribosomal protein S18 acetylase RimI-like enzyme
MSLHADYIKERGTKEIIESEKGFLTYFFVNDGVYIEDLYISPAHRKSHLASQMADQVAAIAKEKGYYKMYGSVAPSAQGSTDSLRVLLAYGMKLDSAGPNAVILAKELN